MSRTERISRAENNSTALLLTQYDRFGTVGKDEYFENFIDEELDVDLDMLNDYNEYLSDLGYEPYYMMDELEDILAGCSHIEVIRMTYFGKFNFADEIFQFNGYGNIDTFSEGQIIREMREDRDFLKWYVEQNDLIDFDSEKVQNDIEDANTLLAIGY